MEPGKAAQLYFVFLLVYLIKRPEEVLKEEIPLKPSKQLPGSCSEHRSKTRVQRRFV
jgi:hypothetical protein